MRYYTLILKDVVVDDDDVFSMSSGNARNGMYIYMLSPCKALIQELSYRKQIARKLRTQYIEGIYNNPT